MSKSVTGPDGTVYASMTSAARALGVHVETIRLHLRQYGDLSMIGTWCVPVAKGSKRWPSIMKAAKALGVTHGTIRGHLRKYGNLDRLGLHGGRRAAKPIRIGPVVWDAKVDARRDLGISKPTLYAWTSSQATPAQRARLMEAVMRFHAQREAATRKAHARALDRLVAA